MGEVNQIWKDKHTQMVMERIAETLFRIEEDQSSLCRGIDELRIILNSMGATSEE